MPENSAVIYRFFTDILSVFHTSAVRCVRTDEAGAFRPLQEVRMKSERRNFAGREGWKSFLKLAAGIILIILLYLSGIEKVPESAISRAERETSADKPAALYCAVLAVNVIV